MVDVETADVVLDEFLKWCRESFLELNVTKLRISVLILSEMQQVLLLPAFRLTKL